MFHVKFLHLGHLAKSFALREAPGDMVSGKLGWWCAGVRTAIAVARWAGASVKLSAGTMNAPKGLPSELLSKHLSAVHDACSGTCLCPQHLIAVLVCLRIAGERVNGEVAKTKRKIKAANSAQQKRQKAKKRSINQNEFTSGMGMTSGNVQKK